MREGIRNVIITLNVILIVTNVVSSFSEHTRDRWEYTINNCTEEMNMTDDEFKEAAKYAKGPDISEDPRTICFFKCLLEVFGMIDEYGNGSPNMEFIGLSIKEEMIEEVSKCFSSEKSDPCDRGYHVWTCMNQLALKSQNSSN